MKEADLRQHLFELSYALDSYSAGKDYVALRRTHYENIEWLHKNDLTEEYYKVLFEHIKERRKGDERL